ncbi:MAG: hypothetical protein JKY54_19235 [Flavobacteriales bacterium]|nr:hypothetical protein [Flavobacteriales bacterium]
MRSERVFTVLHRNEAGAVAMCDQCDHVHIEIENVITVLSPAALEDILIELSHRKMNLDDYTVKTLIGPRIVIRLTDAVFLSLTKINCIRLIELFEISSHMLAVKTLITR